MDILGQVWSGGMNLAFRETGYHTPLIASADPPFFSDQLGVTIAG
jgi:hypothetical protein